MFSAIYLRFGKPSAPMPSALDEKQAPGRPGRIANVSKDKGLSPPRSDDPVATHAETFRTGPPYRSAYARPGRGVGPRPSARRVAPIDHQSGKLIR